MSIRRNVILLLPLLGAIFVTGCESLKGGGSKKPKQVGPYKIPSPPGAGWKRVGEGESVSYIKVNDAADDDVVTLFVAFEETGNPIGTAAEVVTRMQARGSSSMQEVVEDEFNGVRGARFTAYQEDTGSGGTTDERESLGLPIREAGMRFYVRTKGFVFADPKRPTRLIKIGISRTSFHGFIGTHFESMGDSFMASFFSENNLANTELGVGGFIDPGRMREDGGGDLREGGGAREIPGGDRPPDFDF